MRVRLGIYLGVLFIIDSGGFVECYGFIKYVIRKERYFGYIFLFWSLFCRDFGFFVWVLVLFFYVGIWGTGGFGLGLIVDKYF